MLNTFLKILLFVLLISVLSFAQNYSNYDGTRKSFWEIGGNKIQFIEDTAWVQQTITEDTTVTQLTREDYIKLVLNRAYFVSDDGTQIFPVMAVIQNDLDSIADGSFFNFDAASGLMRASENLIINNPAINIPDTIRVEGDFSAYQLNRFVHIHALLSSQTLDEITNGTKGQELYLINYGSLDITFETNKVNLLLGSSDINLSQNDVLIIWYDGSNWIRIGYQDN